MTNKFNKKIITVLPPSTEDMPVFRNMWIEKEVLEAAEAVRKAQQKEEEWIHQNLKD